MMKRFLPETTKFFFRSKLFRTILFLLLVMVVSFTTFAWAFSLDLRSEDWYQLWFAIQPNLKDVVFQTIIFRDHPISTYQELAFSSFFGFSPIYWHIFGYFLKIIDALTVGLLVYGITRVKKAALYSSLIFAASVGGLEAFITLYAQSAALIIPLMCLGLYFWVVSSRERSLKKYLISIIFFLMAFLGDPGRGISMIGLGLLWDFIYLMQNRSKGEFVRALARNFFLVTFLIIIYISAGNEVTQFTSGHPSSLNNGLNYIVVNPVQSLNNFANAIGILLIGWFTSVFESGHMSHISYLDLQPLIASVAFLIVFIFLLMKSIFKKGSQYTIFWIFFSIWIVITYFPTWLLLQWFVAGMLPGVTGRYLTIPSVGLVSLLGYILSRFKKSIAIPLLICIILFNVFTANRILKEEWYYRSLFVHNLFWDEVDKVVPKGEKNIIFMFIGSTHLPSELASQQSIPFALKRGINKIEDLPIITGDKELIKRLLCENNSVYPNPLTYGPGRLGSAFKTEKIPISHLYVWKFDEYTFVNVTQQERKILRLELNCKLNDS